MKNEKIRYFRSNGFWESLSDKKKSEVIDAINNCAKKKYVQLKHLVDTLILADNVYYCSECYKWFISYNSHTNNDFCSDRCENRYMQDMAFERKLNKVMI